MFSFTKKLPTTMQRIAAPLSLVIVLLLLVIGGTIAIQKNAHRNDVQYTQRVGVNSVLRLRFPQAMNVESVAEHLSLPKDVQGELSWETADTLAIHPAAGLQLGKTYVFRIDKEVKASDGTSPAHDIVFTFIVSGAPSMTASVPPPGTSGVPVDAHITLIFDRPMIALATLDDATRMPGNWNATIDPPLKGRWRWLSTYAVEWAPEEKMKAATHYTVRVPAGILSVEDEPTETDYSFSFDTTQPFVKGQKPEPSEAMGSNGTISITFSQPMDLQSASSLVRLRSVLSGAARCHPLQGSPAADCQSIVTQTGSTKNTIPVSLSYGTREVSGKKVLDDRILVVTPKSALAMDTEFVVDIPKSVQAKEGNLGTASYQAVYVHTAGPFTLGTVTLSDYNGVVFPFTNDVDKQSFAANITFDPPVKNIKETIEQSWQDYEKKLYLSPNLEPSTTYTIKVSGKVKDAFGQLLGKDSIQKITTPQIPPVVNIESKGTFGIFERAKPPVFSVSAVNVSTIHTVLTPLAIEEILSLRQSQMADWQFEPAFAGHAGATVKDLVPKKKLNETYRKELALNDFASKTLAPGIYGLSLSAPEEKDYQGRPVIHTQLVAITNMAMTLKYSADKALVWVTDMTTGVPVNGATIKVRSVGGAIVATAKTNADGIAEMGIKLSDLESGNNNRGNPEFYVTAEKLDDFAFVGSNWSDGLRSWDFQNQDGFVSTYDTRNQLLAYAYTDRPLYGAGDTVHYKGVLRLRDKFSGAITAPKSPMKAQLTIRDPEGNQVEQKMLDITGFGTVSGDFTMPAKPVLGSYSLHIALTPEAELSQYDEAMTSFSVLSYRKPDFRLELTPKVADAFDGDTVEADVEANYFFGAPLGNVNINWRAQTTDYYFNRYTDGYYSFGTFDSWCYGNCERNTAPLTEGTTKLDANGHGLIRIPVSLKDKKTSQILTIEADVSDQSNTLVSASTSVPVHKSSVYVGILTNDYIVQPGETATAEVVAVDPQAKPLRNQTVAVSLYSRTWNTVQKQSVDGEFYEENEATDTFISQKSVQTNAQGKASAGLKVPSGGEYVLVATAKDSAGRESKASTSIYVWSNTFMNWPHSTNERIEVITDKPAYKPGDTAHLIVKSPFQGEGVKALVTVERERVRKSWVIDMQSAAQSVDVPVTEDLLPNAFVSVVVMKPRQGETFDKDNIDTGVPAFRIGYARLSVERNTKAIDVQLTPSALRTKPQEKVSVAIRTKDSSGKGISAEVSLSVVDMSLLSLTGFYVPELLDTFYGDRALGVQTSAMLKYLVERFKPGTKGGGGGDGENHDSTRESFKDTAYWKANIVTNAEGNATVEFTLPDNLTTWKLLAIAASKNNTFGATSAEILTTKEVLLRPVLPKFAIKGDRITASAIVRNDLQKAATFQVSAVGSGVTLDGATHATVKLAKGEQKSVPFTMTVNDVKSATVTFRTETQGASDAVKITFPVLVGPPLVTVATTGEVTDAVQEHLQIPAKADTEEVSAHLTLSSSMAAWLNGSLTYLLEYPYWCSEQITSRFLGNVVLLGIPGFEQLTGRTRTDIQKMVSSTLPEVYAYQRSDGGFAYFKELDRSDPAVSAYIAYGLLQAKKENFAVDERVLDRTYAYLQSVLRSTDVRNQVEGALRVRILWVLAEAGRPDAQALNASAKNRATLPLFAQAELAMALQKAGGSSQALAKVVMNELLGHAKVDPRGMHFEEEQPELWQTLFHSEARATGLVLQALSRIEPEHQLLPQVVRSLLELRRDGHWDSTQSSITALLAFRDVMRARNEGEGTAKATIILNGKEFATASFPKTAVLTKQEFTIEESKLTPGRDNLFGLIREGTGRLYYDLTLSYRLKNFIEPRREEGISIMRELQTLDGKPVTEPKVGETYKMMLTVTSAQSRHAVGVSAPLPAGLELVNSGFLTSPQLLMGTLSLGESQDESDATQDMSNEERYWMQMWTPEVFTHTELRDDELFLFAEDLPAGVYRYAVLVRGMTPGKYYERPAKAWQMYYPEVFGQTPSRIVTVKEAQ